MSYRILEDELEALNTERSKKLIHLTKLRFSSTADIELAKLCFFTTIAGISEKTKNYPHLPSIFIRDAQNPLNTIINIEVEFLESFNSILEKVCDKLLNDENVIKIFFQ